MLRERSAFLRGARFSSTTARKRSASRRVEGIARTLSRAGADRHCVLVAVGGGVVGDVAGFAAATYLRGVRIVHVPTTLVAQVDSSIGGKTGVDLPEGKNLVGAFHPPKLVIADPDMLRTLPHREYRSGLYEVVKYGIIADPKLFRFLEAHMNAVLRRDPAALDWIIPRCIAIKARVVNKDEREAGLTQDIEFRPHAGARARGRDQLQALSTWRSDCMGDDGRDSSRRRHEPHARGRRNANVPADRERGTVALARRHTRVSIAPNHGGRQEGPRRTGSLGVGATRSAEQSGITKFRGPLLHGRSRNCRELQHKPRIDPPSEWPPIKISKEILRRFLARGRKAFATSARLPSAFRKCSRGLRRATIF